MVWLKRSMFLGQRRGQKETKCTSKRRIEAGIKPSARATRELRSLGQLICKKSQNMILARLEPYQLLISMRERPFLEMAVLRATSGTT